MGDVVRRVGEAGLADAYTYTYEQENEQENKRSGLKLGGAGTGIGKGKDIGDGEDEMGFTWGYQPPSEFPPNRLDKVLYTANETFRIERPRIMGVDVKTATAQEGLWVSDHYGLETTVHILPQPA